MDNKKKKVRSHIIVVEVDGEDVELHFMHIREKPMVANTPVVSFGESGERHITVCYILRSEPISIAGWGVTILHPGETDNPFEAQKHALARALEGYNKPLKQQVWRGFLKYYNVSYSGLSVSSPITVDEFRYIEDIAKMIDELGLAQTGRLIHTGVL